MLLLTKNFGIKKWKIGGKLETTIKRQIIGLANILQTKKRVRKIK
jgi:hypothetical protein